MKTAKRVAVTMVFLCASLVSSFATGPKLLLPRGLAVDSQGNLYVANSAGNNILVYSPGYTLQKLRTITQDISNPMGVAFDPMGNLWVANFNSNTVTAYNAGIELTKFTITAAQGINNPFAIAVDGANNVYVQNNWSSISIYYPYQCQCMVQLATFDGNGAWPANSLRGIASGGGSTVVGYTGGWWQFQTDYDFLIPGSLTGLTFNHPFSLATDNHGGFYMADDDGSVYYFGQALGYGVSNTFRYVVQLSYVPTGVAVDNARGRLYFSNYDANTIDVYTTAGVYLHTIK